MQKILFLGRKIHSYRFVQEALAKGGFSVSFGNIEEITPDFSPSREFVLVLLELSLFNDSIPDILFTFLTNMELLGIPTLGILKSSQARVRQRLVESGLRDYLYLPFDKLDLQIRVKNLLSSKSQAGSDQPTENSFHANIRQAFLEMAALLVEINHLVREQNASLFLKKALTSIKSIVHGDYILIFEVENDLKLVLNTSLPLLPVSGKLEINSSEVVPFQKAVKLGEYTVLNQINPNNELYFYFKSHFNLQIKAFGVFPVQSNGNTRAVLTVLFTQNRKFSDFHFRYIQLIVFLIETLYLLQKTVDASTDSTTPEMWKYSFKFLEHVINQLNFGILVVDREKRIRYLNKPAEELINRASREILNKPIAEVLGERNTRILFESLEEKEGAYERPEIEIIRENEEKLLIGFTVSEFWDREIREKGYLISLKDITYSKELQEEMRRMDRLASLGVMASGIAHEIRNPLAGIKAIAQTFEEELDPDDPKTEFVKRIIKQVNRLDDMLKSLFSYAKPQKPNRQFYQIETILQEVLALLKQNLYKKNIKLSQSTTSHVPELFVDASQIQQVLFNLILNSIESIENDGKIDISIEAVPRDYKKFQRKPFYRLITENPYVLIRIQDTGCGISRENLQKIFNPFFTTKTFGTGLGLSIVYQIVKENNGVIYFDSRVGEGTDCYLFLPAFAPDQKNKITEKV